MTIQRAITVLKEYNDWRRPEGGHWSVDSGEQLAALIDDFKERVYKKTLIEKEDQNV